MDITPIETWDHIISFIDEPAVLACVARVSQQFCALATPVLNYRVIRCPLNVVDLWNYLAQNPYLAKRVRVLSIYSLERMHGEPISVPPPFLEPVKQCLHTPKNRTNHRLARDDERRELAARQSPEKSFLCAMKHMTGLKAFTWLHEPPLVNAQLDSESKDLWTTLSSSHSLESLDILGKGMDYFTFYAPVFRLRPMEHSKIFSITNLTRFSYNASFSQVALMPVEKFEEFLLHNCPKLQLLSLNIFMYHSHSVDLDHLFSGANWPELDTLSIKGVHMFFPTASEFFLRHPLISSLIVDPETWPLVMFHSDPFPPVRPFSDNILPNLTGLDCAQSLAIAILSTPCVQTRPLASLRLFHPSHGHSKKTLLKFLRHSDYGLSLRTLSFSRLTLDNLKEVASATPNITEITIDHLVKKQNPRTSTGWIDTFALFPKLEVVTGFNLLKTKFPRGAHELFLRRLAERCPQIRRIELFDVVQPPEVIILYDMNRTKVYCELSRDASGAPVLWTLSIKEIWGWDMNTRDRAKVERLRTFFPFHL